MTTASTATEQRAKTRPAWLDRPDYALRQGILKLLAIKDSDIRLLILEQCPYAVDQGLHAGGAFSATIPLVALYYGGFLNLDIEDPTRVGQDTFVLSKGHAVAALASIYAELGYFDRAVLSNSRSHTSILNGHPGPLLPGVPIATETMGQGFGVAQGFALAGKRGPYFDSYCMTGDGELQEGPIWEAVMFAGQKHLDNLCLLVDQNNGQLDISSRMVFPLPNLEAVFAAFNWNVHSADTTSYDGVYSALEAFRFGQRNGKPTAIICHSTKGHGALSDFWNKHKVVGAESLLMQEIALQSELRACRVEEFREFHARLGEHVESAAIQTVLEGRAREMHLELLDCAQVVGPVVTRRVPHRDARIRYDAALLPKIDPKKEYSAADNVTGAMKIFARDRRIVSIDSDLATTSGLEAGVGAVDQRRALNAGVAEANMMALGEAFAVLGHNAWISTFCPFWDWKVMRRIAVGYQERLESMQAADGWLSEGHGLDLTHARHRRQLRNPHERRDPHGERRCNRVRRHRTPENRRRLLSPAVARNHEVDHGGQPRADLPTGDADTIGRDLWWRFPFRVRQRADRPARRRRPRGDCDQRPRRSRGAGRGHAVSRPDGGRHAVDR
jgi:transketolase N-terminal domain/subunit